MKKHILSEVLIGLVLFTFFIAMPIFTYGHSLNNKAFCSGCEFRAIEAVPATLGYPLYWSWELQREKEN